MDKKRWKQVEDLFDAALQLSEEQRDQFLLTQCGDDRALYNEVKSLLTEDSHLHTALQDSPVSAVFDLSANQQYIGKIFGIYRIDKLIASGGMGSVFLASRNDGVYEQQVALKIIHSGLKSAAFLNGFQREQQILAALNHPNIAHLLDGGVTDEGTPYLVMEYIQGVPLDIYVREKKLTLKQRLTLFIKVCEAVSYAHHHLVIHRDLKPGNIFVTDDGQVKLLDFGIAKVFDPEKIVSGMQTITEGGSIPFTPEYAAPEQIDGGNVSTVSDVYSLGVTLYELLCGKRPHRFKSKQLLEIQQVLHNEVPKKPSVAMRQETEFSETEQPAFSGNEQILRSRRLKGDLDNICLKTLKKEPELRYSSVEMLKIDIDRHLRGMPVSATNDNLPYRVTKYVKRHKLAVSLTSFFILAITLISIFYTWQLKQETERAQQEALKTGQVAEFMKSLFEAASPELAKGKKLDAIDLLEAGAKNIENGLYEQPEVQAEMFTIIGDVYRRIGRYEEAETMETKALERNLTFHGKQSEQVAHNHFNLGMLYRELGQYERAESNLLIATELHEFVRQDVDFFKVDVLTGRADLKYETRDLKNSDSLYVLAWDILKQVSGKESVRAAAILNGRAAVARHLGDYEKAETLYIKTLALRKKVSGPDDADVAHTLNHIARLYDTMGRYAEAEAYAREGLALRERIFGEAHQETAASLSNLASILKNTGQFEEAVKYYTRSYNAFSQLLGEKHPFTGATSYNLGTALYGLGRNEDAEIRFRQAMRINDKLLLPEHIRNTNPWIALGTLLTDRNDVDEAHALLEKAYAMRLKILGTEDKLTGVAASAFGYCLYKMGRLTEAEEKLRAGFVILKQKSAEEKTLRRTFQLLKTIYEGKGDIEKLSTLNYRTETE